MLDLRLALAAPLALALAGCGAAPPSPETAPPLPTLETLLVEQTELYPLMREEDLYKLISQATRGPAVPFIGRNSELDTGLYDEVKKLSPSPAAPAHADVEPLVEVLDPARNLARINLRPFLRRGGEVDDLARAVGETHRVFRGDRAVFESSLRVARDLLEQDALVVAFDADRFWKLVQQMREKGYPPGVHSRAYADTYAPAYRIVRRDTLTDREYGGREGEALLEGLGGSKESRGEQREQGRAR
ncbi:MAG: hypothetical protein ACF8XB_05950 [Planctomycetota bacterium JB042]